MKKNYLQLVLSFLVFFSALVKAQTISTIAGSGTKGYNGDNIAATIAQLNAPAGVTLDDAGNLYIADFMNNRVRKVDANGFITTIAGNGTVGYNGDNIPATNAQLYSPVAVAFDHSNNLFVSDGNNNRVRRISSSGIITTFAGTGSYGYNGDNIAATIAQVNYPTDGLLIDAAGNIIFSDSYNHRIRKVSTSGIITTIAGTGSAGYNGDNILATSAQLNLPYGLTLDGAGNLYLVDGGNQRVRKISTSGIISTIAGTGVAGYNGDNIQAISAMLNNPRSVVVDAAGSIFIADALNQRIRKVNNSGIISTIAGNGTANYNGDNIPAAMATLNFPNSLVLDVYGNLLVAELGNNRIRKITNAAVILPLSLTYFTAQIKNSYGLLHWKTSNEVNTLNFVVEYSNDSRAFSTLSTVKADNTTGKHEYMFTDVTIKQGTTFYRLKMVDKNGFFTYSNIVTLKTETTDILMNLYPNPTSDLANFTFISNVAGKYSIQITDVGGKVIRQMFGNTVVGTNLLKIDLHRYRTGTYILTIINPEKLRGDIKFIKQ